MTEPYDFSNDKFTTMLCFFPVVEAKGLIHPCPSGENSRFAFSCDGDPRSGPPFPVLVLVGIRFRQLISSIYLAAKEVASKFLWPMEPPSPPPLSQSVSNLAQRLFSIPYFNIYYFFGRHNAL